MAYFSIFVVYNVDCKWILIKSINIVYTKNYLFFSYLLSFFFFYNPNNLVTVFSLNETINYLFNKFKEDFLHEIRN